MSFHYDIKRKTIIQKFVAGVVKNKDLIEVPNAYRIQFENKPEQALSVTLLAFRQPLLIRSSASWDRIEEAS